MSVPAPEHIQNCSIKTGHMRRGDGIEEGVHVGRGGEHSVNLEAQIVGEQGLGFMLKIYPELFWKNLFKLVLIHSLQRHFPLWNPILFCTYEP